MQTLQERVEAHSTKVRAETLLRHIGAVDQDFPLTEIEALGWCMIAEQTFNGEFETSLHALIAGSVPFETLAFIATGKVLTV